MILPRIPTPAALPLIAAVSLLVAAADGLHRAIHAGGRAIEAAADLLTTDEET